MKLVLLGAPGSGKGTQAKMLEKRFKIPHISTGDLLREIIKKKSPLKKKTKKFLERGELVPDKIVTEVIKNRLKRSNCSNGFILDGFPRNISQAKVLDNLLKERKTSLDRVIYLDTPEEILVQRLKLRRICSDCQAVFHLKNSPPKKDLVCDFCKGKLYQREDDKEDTVKRRFRIYLKKTESLIDYYSRQKKLIRVEASGDKETVLKRILARLNPKFALEI